jgi:hypothetical protein
MKIIEFGKHTYNAPDKFSELTLQQLMAVAEAVAAHKPLADGKLYIASKWFPEAYQTLSKYLKSDKEQALKLVPGAIERFEETNKDLNALAQMCGWVNSDKTHVTSNWLVSEITINGTTYLGPSNKLSNLEFWEYCKADTHFSRYQKTNSLAEFAKFLACIYRIANRDLAQVEQSGNARIPFNDKRIITDSAKFMHVDAATRVAITLNYVAIKHWLKRVFTEVFRSATKGDENGNDTNQDIGRMYGRLLLNIAKRRHQDEEVIARKPLLLVLEDQNDEMERVREYNEQIKNLR